MKPYKGNYNTSSSEYATNITIISKIMHFLRDAFNVHNQRPHFKISEVQELFDKPGKTTFIVQVDRKNCFTRFSAQDIQSNPNLINNFGYEDQALIHAAVKGEVRELLERKKRQESSEYEIISKNFDKKISEHMFVIYSKANDTVFKISTSELSNQKELMKELYYLDIFDIGYTKASDNVIKAEKAIKESKNNSGNEELI